MSAENRAVKAAIDAALAERGEIGIQAAAYLDGELVIDVWGGLADETTGRPVDEDTLFPVFSVSKAVTATGLHIQAEHGLIDYESPIARYWPEFAAEGKQAATVRDLLLHRAGVPHLPEGTTPEQLCDWDGMCAAIAALKPSWLPGTQTGYHGYTQGWIIGEIVRRTDPRHRLFSAFIQDELCAPLGITGLWFGIPDEVEPRVAKLTNMPPRTAAAAEAGPRRTPTTPLISTTQEVFGRADMRRGCIPSVGGIMNARSVARHYAMLAMGGTLDGVRVLSGERIEYVSRLHSEATDSVLGGVRRRGLGYSLGRTPGSFGHAGIGGSVATCDPHAGFAVAVLHNRMVQGTTPEENPVIAITASIRRALKLPE